MTVALRGALSSSASSPNAAPGPSVATLRPRRLTLAVPDEDHEELRAGRTLAHEDPPGVDLHVLGPAGDEGELLAGEGGEEGYLREVPEKGVVARHGAGI